jgi:FMN-dependent NADH-azoreductase
LAALLRVDAGIRDASVSREVADTFEREWAAGQDGARVSRRDLRAAAPGCLTERGEDAVAAALVDEILDADLLLVAAPMYNWSVPAALKSWIDHVISDPRVAADRLLFAGRPVVIVSARGGAYGPESPKAGWDHAEPYLRTIFEGHLGLEAEVILAELTLAPVIPAMAALRESAARSLRDAHRTAGETARRHAQPARTM